MDTDDSDDELVDRDVEGVEEEVDCAELVEELEAEPAEAHQGLPCRTLLFFVISMMAAFSAAIYSFLEPSHSRAEDMSEQWWNAMSFWIKILSIAMAANTQIVNTIFFFFFTESAFFRCKDSMATYAESCKNFTVNTLHILLSFCAALANGAIAYQSYQWLPAAKISAIFPSMLNGGVTFASRYAGLHNLTGRISAVFDEDARLQKQCLTFLQHINPAFEDEINALLENQPINEEALHGLFQELSEHEDSVTPVSTWETWKHGFALAFDFSFFLSVMIPTFMLFAQKGYDGVELLCDEALNDVHPVGKIAAGFLPGSVSSIFMAINALEFRQVMVDLSVHVSRHPLHIPLAILALIMNAVSAGVSWKHIAVSAISPANIFSLTSTDSPMVQAYIYLNVLGSFVASFKAMVQKIIDSEEPSTNLERLISWLQKSRISSSTAEQLRRFSLFSGRAETGPAQSSSAVLSGTGIEP